MENEIAKVLVSYLNPSLVMIFVTAYLVGLLVKRSKMVSDKWVILCVAFYAGGMSVATLSLELPFVSAFIEGVPQGILITGLCVLSNQLPKQLRKKE